MGFSERAAVVPRLAQEVEDLVIGRIDVVLYRELGLREEKFTWLNCEARDPSPCVERPEGEQMHACGRVSHLYSALVFMTLKRADPDVFAVSSCPVLLDR